MEILQTSDIVSGQSAVQLHCTQYIPKTVFSSNLISAHLWITLFLKNQMSKFISTSKKEMAIISSLVHTKITGKRTVLWGQFVFGISVTSASGHAISVSSGPFVEFPFSFGPSGWINLEQDLIWKSTTPVGMFEQKNIQLFCMPAIRSVCAQVISITTKSEPTSDCEKEVADKQWTTRSVKSYQLVKCGKCLPAAIREIEPIPVSISAAFNEKAHRYKIPCPNEWFKWMQTLWRMIRRWKQNDWFVVHCNLICFSFCRALRHAAFRYVYAVPGNGQRICDANKYVGGHCGHGEPHICWVFSQPGEARWGMHKLYQLNYLGK